MHVWDVWNSRDYLAYREHKPQFVAEFGFQGPPTWSTLTRAVSDRPLTVSTPNLMVHQKAHDGTAKLARWLAPHFPEPASFEDWHWAMSLNQARAVTLAVEYWRSLAPRCRGAIVWQLNDCWPVISWAAIDGDGRLKPLWYAAPPRVRGPSVDRPTVAGAAGARPGASGQAPSAQALSGELSVVAVNDGATTWQAQLEVVRQDFVGTVRAKGALTLVAGPGQSASAALGPEVTTPDNPAEEVLVVSGDGLRALWFFGEDRDLALPAPGLGVARGTRQRWLRGRGRGFDVAALHRPPG